MKKISKPILIILLIILLNNCSATNKINNHEYDKSECKKQKPTKIIKIKNIFIECDKYRKEIKI